MLSEMSTVLNHKSSANPSGFPVGEAFCTDFEFADDNKLPCCPRCTTLSLDHRERGVGARLLYQLCRRASMSFQGSHPLGPFAIRLTSWGHVERFPSRRLFCNRENHSQSRHAKKKLITKATLHIVDMKREARLAGIHAGQQKYRAVSRRS